MIKKAQNLGEGTFFMEWKGLALYGTRGAHSRSRDTFTLM